MPDRVSNNAERVIEHGERIAALEERAAASQQERHAILQTAQQTRDISQRNETMIGQVLTRLDAGHARFEALGEKVDSHSQRLQELESTARTVNGGGGSPGLVGRTQALETQQTKWNAIIGFMAVIGSGLIAAGAWVASHLHWKP